MNIRKFGGIDIGSNGVRLLIANVLEEENKVPIFSKASLVRVPIRLGEDVFESGEISKGNTERLSEAIQAFSLLMKVYNVEKYQACATSAMREAKNGREIVLNIAKKTGIYIEIIDGQKEAAIIANTDLHSFIENDKNYLYIDVGGGSTEFTIYSKGNNLASKSFPIGAVRLLRGKATNKIWEEVEEWIVKKTKNIKNIQAIGSGGNINKIFKASGNKKGEPLSLSFLNDFLNKLESLSYEERIRDLELNPDRADVITYATRVYINAMKWAKAENIIVPKVGLSDGIIRGLYYNNI
ncbi:MAG: ethanolamine ammonia-lyase reactivating factor EutA [Capnocytophaga sp.]|nr:ethanolamine ammonia-lyase reactivating factor EutA [Capnocytophaga sp.]